MSKHTPGPWEVAFEEAVRVKDCLGSTVATATHLRANGRRRPEEVSANARLIAASPEMYEALKRLAGCDWEITLPDRMDAVRKIARDAIAKVEAADEQN